MTNAQQQRKDPLEIPRLQSVSKQQAQYNGGNVARGHAQMLAMAAGHGKVQGV